jgi:Mor family transcriptional regulator
MPRPKVLGETVTIPIVLNRELYEKLRAEALRRNTSMSNVVRFLIDAYLFDTGNSGNNNESKEQESPLRELELLEFNDALKTLEARVEYVLKLSERIRVVQDHVEIPQSLNLKAVKELWQKTRKQYDTISRYLNKEEKLMTEKRLVYLYKALKEIEDKIETLKKQYTLSYTQ